MPTKKKKTISVKVAVKKKVQKAKPAKKAVKKAAKKKPAVRKALKLSKTAYTALDAVAAAGSASASEGDVATDSEDEAGDVFHITQIAVTNCVVFGLGVDQRIYRWDPRNGTWKPFKEGV